MTTSPTLSMEDISNPKPLAAGEIEYYRHRLKNRVFEIIWLEFVRQSDECGLTKRTIAVRLNKEPSQITRWLSGPSNLTIETVSDFLLAMDCEPDISVSSLMNRPTPNYIHPVASPASGGHWITSTQSTPINFSTATTGSRLVHAEPSWIETDDRTSSSY